MCGTVVVKHLKVLHAIKKKVLKRGQRTVRQDGNRSLQDKKKKNNFYPVFRVLRAQQFVMEMMTPFTCSKSTMETPEQYEKFIQS